MHHGYLIPGYRSVNGHLKSARCFCTDGCPGRDCDASIADADTLKFSRLYYPDFEWRRIPPNDSLDDAVRNRNERVREVLRKKLRYRLDILKHGDSYGEDDNG